MSANLKFVYYFYSYYIMFFKHSKNISDFDDGITVHKSVTSAMSFQFCARWQFQKHYPEYKE